jgi:hypothetical protein
VAADKRVRERTTSENLHQADNDLREISEVTSRSESLVVARIRVLRRIKSSDFASTVVLLVVVMFVGNVATDIAKKNVSCDPFYSNLVVISCMLCFNVGRHQVDRILFNKD